MGANSRSRPSDRVLRLHYDFVHAFEALRRRFNAREMNDAVLHEIAGALGGEFNQLRMARSLRNAIAHGESANPERVEEYLRLLARLIGEDMTEPERQESQPDSGRRAYRIHAWLDADLERLMLADGFVSVGGDEVGDLSTFSGTEEIRTILEEAMPDRSPRARGIFVGYWRRFLWEAANGDVVVVPTRERGVAIGEFTGSYAHVAHAEPHARHRRAVDWRADSVDPDVFGDDLRKVLRGRHTIQDFKAPGAAHRLLVIADSGIDPG